VSIFGKDKRFSAYSVGLLATAVLVPGLAGFLSVILYLGSKFPEFSWFINSKGARAYGFGSLFAVGGWLLCALAARNYAQAAGANPSEYAKLKEIYDVLDARAWASQPATPDQMAALAEAHVNLKYAAPSFTAEGPPRPSLRWGTGDAYLDLRERLHRAEEALIGVEPASLAIGEAGYDVRRIEGGRFADSKRLLAAIDEAQTALTADPNDATARAKLRQVRRAINEYRDSLRAGLIRARNHLFATAIYASLNAYALLGVAMIWNASRSAILAAAAFYLIGATVGLFRQLQLASSATTTQEDYGLESMRLIQTPLFSGLAAVGGVVLLSIVPALTPALPPATTAASRGATTTAAAPGATTTTSATTTSTPATTTTSTPRTNGRSIPSLESIFDLGKNEMGLVIAAVFGLTPTLLVARLRAQSEGLKSGLKSSELGGETTTG
jgi:hypothetical protein